MLTYTCNVCSHSFPAEITYAGLVIYHNGNKRISLVSDKDDCEGCKVEIEKEVINVTDEARARIKARKAGAGQVSLIHPI